MSDEPRVIRNEIPVDDAWHDLALSGPILHVDTRDPAKVEVWSLDDPARHAESVRWFRVYGTGHPIERLASGSHVGSVVTAGGALVWHLFERVTA